jgi:dihydrofolate reductase
MQHFCVCAHDFSIASRAASLGYDSSSIPALQEAHVRKIVLLEHISVDGFLAGRDGDMNWIHVDDEIWEHVHPVIDGADAVIWGRLTYEMMEAYWPTAADSPGATAHDIHHGRWLRDATKLVFSRSLTAVTWPNTRIVNGDPRDVVTSLKRERGKNVVLIGSASIARDFIRLGLIDEYRLTVNPVLLGQGTRLFPDLESTADLELVSSKPLASGVVALHYKRK